MENANLIKFNETSLAADTITTFNQKLSAMLSKEDAKLLYFRFFECCIRFLAKFKSQNKPVAISINDLSTDNPFIIGFLVEYQPPENNDNEMPGNWTVVASFNQDDIINKEKNTQVYNLQESMFVAELNALLQYHGSIMFEKSEDLLRCLVAVFNVMKSHLLYQANKSDKPYGVDFDLFKAFAAKENGEIVTSIEIDGELKKLIKDDSGLEFQV